MVAAVFIWIFLFVQDVTHIFGGINRLLIWGIPSLLFFVLVFKFFENRPVPKFLIFAGNISYSLYITHTFVVQPFSRLVYDIDVITPIGVLLVFIVVLPLCFVTAFISWYVVEYKITEFLRRKLNFHKA